MLSIEKLMMMDSMEEVNKYEAELKAQRRESIEYKYYIMNEYDINETDVWLELEETLQDIDYIEKNLETIKDYRDNYDYYWDMI